MTNPPDTEEVFQATYAELRRLATNVLRRERPNHTLQPTALVHEAYFRLSKKGRPWKDREHFLALAARAMRQVLVDWARSRSQEKRGGGGQIRITLDDAALQNSLSSATPNAAEVLKFDDALSRLEHYDTRKASVVEMRVFAGLTIEETAAQLSISEATVSREWRSAQAWLARFLLEGENQGSEDGIGPV